MDLTDPVYKGHLVMPNPNSSGTGFLDVSSWLQIYGERGGWQFMDNLHKNIAWYTHSGSKPCKQAARGETPIGISFAFRGAKSKAAGAPLEIVLPKEGVGWDMEATAIVKGTKKLAAAQTLADWSITKKANVLYNKGYAVVAYPGVAKPVKHFPAGILEAMIDNDFEFAAVNPSEFSLSGKNVTTESQKLSNSGLKFPFYRVGFSFDPDLLNLTMPESKQNFLRIDNLTKHFGEFVAVQELSLEINDGEFICFLGPSGCGKTTLLRAIAGLDPQSSGSITQAGKDISNLPPSQRDFGIVFQSYAPFSEPDGFPECGLWSGKSKNSQTGNPETSQMIYWNLLVCRNKPGNIPHSFQEDNSSVSHLPVHSLLHQDCCYSTNL